MNLPGITICRATTVDIPVIRQIAYETWPVTYGDILGSEQLDYMLRLIYSAASLSRQMQEGSTFLLLEDDKEVVAFAAYFLKSPGVYKLDKLYALPARQGKGYGKMLIQYIIDEIRAAGATALQLNVNRHNTKAQAFYRHLQFRVIAVADISIGEDFYMNDYIMELTL